MKTLETKIRDICTYYSDDGTNGYLLSEEQFQQIFELVKQAGEVAVEEYKENLIKKIEKEKESHNGECVKPEYYISSGWEERDNGAKNCCDNIINLLKEK